MKYVSPRSASFVAAIAVAATSAVALHAQGSQSAALTAAAAAQAPTDVNVVNVPTVTIGNSDLQPIPVKQPTKEPVYLNFQLQIVAPYSISHDSAYYTIPAGKRLTIEHTSLLCASDTVREAFGAVIANGNALTYFPTHSFPTETGTSSKSVGAVALSAQVNNGSVSVYAGRSASTGTSNCYMTVVGYLTPVQ
jgi:hypothetical protein